MGFRLTEQKQLGSWLFYLVFFVSLNTQFEVQSHVDASEGGYH